MIKYKNLPKYLKYIGKIIKFVGIRLLLIATVIVFFFYSFWFSLSKDSFENFIAAQILYFLPKGNFSIDYINKNLCGFQILGIKYEEIEVQKVQSNFCSFKFLFLGVIPIQVNTNNESLEILYSIWSQKITVTAVDSPDLNSIPFFNRYVGFTEKVKYSLNTTIYSSTSEVDFNFAATNIIFDNKKIPILIRSFLPNNLNFTEAELAFSIQNKRLNFTLLTKGFFNGKLSGIISLTEKFKESKISVRLVGNITNLENLNPVTLGFLKPYLNQNRLELRITGTVGLPKIEKL